MIRHLSLFTLSVLVLAGLFAAAGHPQVFTSVENQRAGTPEMLHASPASPDYFTFQQPDGSSFKARVVGDEAYSILETKAGYTVKLSKRSGYYEFVTRSRKGTFRFTGKYPGTHRARELNLAKHERESREVVSSRVRAHRQQVSAANLKLGPAADAAVAAVPTTGTLQKLVILVNFSDTGTTYSQNTFNGLFNTRGYNSFGALGSVWDYFNEASYGQMDLQTTVTAWVNLPFSAATYGTDEFSHRFWPDGRYMAPAQRMVFDAVTILKNQGFDFGPFDNDGNGWVDALAVIHQGRGEEAGGGAATIWSHKWGISTITDNYGNYISGYYTAPEKYGNSLSTIGVYCHEFGHTLGLPDLYDTDYSSSGIGNWGIMAGGSWNNSGRTPAHFTGWAKARLGWLTPITITLSDPPVSFFNLPVNQHYSHQSVYKITEGFAANEYLLIENRNRAGFDSALPTSGLLITHIDDSQYSNSNENRPKVRVMQADGAWDLENGVNRGDSGDLFPGSSGNRSLSYDTTPRLQSYDNGDTNIVIENISDSGSTMTFDVSNTGGINSAPEVVSVTPNNGSGSSESFSFVFRDADGYADISSVSIVINSDLNPSNGVYFRYDIERGIVYLRNDANSQWYSRQLDAGGVLSNSQVRINTNNISLATNGNNMTLTIPMEFLGSFSGSRQIFSRVRDIAGNQGGYIRVGAYTVVSANSLPAVEYAAPNSGTVDNQVITFRASDADGNNDIESISVVINNQLSVRDGVYLYYVNSSETLKLRNDNHTAWTSGQVGSNVVLQNSQVIIDLSRSSVTRSGANSLELNLHIDFSPSFAGVRNMYMRVCDIADNQDGYDHIGTITVPEDSAAPQLVSMSPANGSGGGNVFTVNISDANGAMDIQSVSIVVNSTLAVQGGIYLRYIAGSNSIYLRNDTNTGWLVESIGTNQTLSNSRVSIDMSQITVTRSGNNFSLSLSMDFSPSFDGQRKFYVRTRDAANMQAGYQQMATYTVVHSNTAPNIVSVSPSAGSGASADFQFTVSDDQGADTILSTSLVMNSSLDPVNGIYMIYKPERNLLYLRNDANSSWMVGTLGTNETLSNGQVSINLSTASVVTNGINLTLSVRMQFSAGFAGEKNMYMRVRDVHSAQAGYTNVGTFNVIPAQ